jgi:hypothetical protein
MVPEVPSSSPYAPTAETRGTQLRFFTSTNRWYGQHVREGEEYEYEGPLWLLIWWVRGIALAPLRLAIGTLRHLFPMAIHVLLF